MVAAKRGATFMFEVRDLWPQTLVDLGAMHQGSAGERLLRAIETFLVRRASIVITLLPGMRDYLVERGLPTNHVRYIPNGVDLELFDRSVIADDTSGPAVELSLKTIQTMKREGRVVFAYLGALGRVNAIDVVIRAAVLAEARSPGRIGLVVIGDGPERLELERLVRGLHHVVLTAPVPKRQVPTLLRAIDVGVVHATANPVYRYGISFNKLFEYSAAALPVVFACDSSYDPVITAEAGISLAPNDPERLAMAMLELADAGPESRAQMGAAARSYVAREHDIAMLAGTLADVILSATNAIG